MLSMFFCTMNLSSRITRTCLLTLLFWLHANTSCSMTAAYPGFAGLAGSQSCFDCNCSHDSTLPTPEGRPGDRQLLKRRCNANLTYPRTMRLNGQQLAHKAHDSTRCRARPCNKSPVMLSKQGHWRQKQQMWSQHQAQTCAGRDTKVAHCWHTMVVPGYWRTKSVC